MSLLQYIKHFNIKADVIVSAHHLMYVDRFYKAGASFVLHPESISLEYLKSILQKESLAKASKLHQKEILTLVQDLKNYI
jgi:Trk K+ transport system NAD-binding subunit